jgi:hypothetical protein
MLCVRSLASPIARTGARPPWRRAARLPGPAAIVLPVLLLAAPGGIGRPTHGPAREAVVPRGTTVSVRFTGAVTGGEDRSGTRLQVRTLAAVVQDGCVLVEPFTEITGRVTRSRAGRAFGRPGELTLDFDSIAVAPGAWAPLDAVVDSLEFAPSERVSAGNIRGARPGMRGRVVRAGALLGVGVITEVGAVPAAVLAGWRVLRAGPQARIVAGEVARLRLREPLPVPRSAACQPVSEPPEHARLAAVPVFTPRTSSDRGGRRAGDPVNLVFLGTAGEIESAFHQAGWTPAQPPGFRSLARGIAAALLEGSAVGAPVSTQYFQGHKQAMAFELAGPNARVRHHLRIWPLEGSPGTWVAAANEDVGLLLNPFHVRATHRISPRVDGERDLIVRELEATGCARLTTYLDPPDAATSGRNAAGQRFRTDGRIATLQLGACAPAAADALADARPPAMAPPDGASQPAAGPAPGPSATVPQDAATR